MSNWPTSTSRCLRTTKTYALVAQRSCASREDVYAPPDLRCRRTTAPPLTCSGSSCRTSCSRPRPARYSPGITFSTSTRAPLAEGRPMLPAGRDAWQPVVHAAVLCVPRRARRHLAARRAPSRGYRRGILQDHASSPTGIACRGSLISDPLEPSARRSAADVRDRRAHSLQADHDRRRRCRIVKVLLSVPRRMRMPEQRPEVASEPMKLIHVRRTERSATSTATDRAARRPDDARDQGAAVPTTGRAYGARRREAPGADRSREVLPHRGKLREHEEESKNIPQLVARDHAADRLLPERGRDHRPRRASSTRST